MFFGSLGPMAGARAMADGASPWTIAGTAGAWASFIALLGVLVRQWVPLRQLKVAADEKLRDDLAERVRALEEKADQERQDHAAALERTHANYLAEIAQLRHRLNNVTQCFDALLLLIEQAPEKADAAAQKVKAMRAAQIQAEAKEKGTYQAARVQAASGTKADQA